MKEEHGQPIRRPRATVIAFTDEGFEFTRETCMEVAKDFKEKGSPLTEKEANEAARRAFRRN